jgi:hypothetical protein
MQILYDSLPKFLGKLFLHFLNLYLGADDLYGNYGNLALMFEMKQCIFWCVIKSKCVFSKIKAHKYMKFEIIDFG